MSAALSATAVDRASGGAQTSDVHRYRVVVTAQLSRVSVVDQTRLRAHTGGSVQVVAVDVVRIEVPRDGRDPACAAERVLIDINRALAPSVRLLRPPVWVARPLGVAGRFRRTTTGRGRIGDDPDDGLGGVREPRRPRPSAGSAAAAIEPDAT